MNFNKVLLDLDADFIVGNAEGEDVKKPYVTGAEYAKYVRWFRKPSTEIHLMVDHHEALYHWDQADVQDALCIHIDAHHDMWRVDQPRRCLIDPNDVDYSIDPRRGLRHHEQIDCGNYLHQALIDEIVKKVIYVPAPFRTLVHERDDIDYELKEKGLARKVQVRSWEMFKRIRTDLPKADIITVAISPEWLPRDLWPEVEIFLHELEVDPKVIRRKKKEASRKWSSDKYRRAEIEPRFDFQFPYKRRSLAIK